MKVIIGLGNPGRRYVGTRHNVGWEAVGRLAARHEAPITRRYRRGWRVVAVGGELTRGGQPVRLLQPQTMMNHSGEALRMLRRDVAPEGCLLVCDDVNLPLGRLRLRSEGSAGGHRGLQSCVEALETERIPRLRLGIGGGVSGADLSGWVLSPFADAERPAAEAMMQRAVHACEMWIEQGIEAAMNQYNTVQDQ